MITRRLLLCEHQTKTVEAHFIFISELIHNRLVERFFPELPKPYVGPSEVALDFRQKPQIKVVAEVRNAHVSRFGSVDDIVLGDDEICALWNFEHDDGRLEEFLFKFFLLLFLKTMPYYCIGFWSASFFSAAMMLDEVK